MFTIVGRYELEASLGLSSACFGKRYAAKIGGRGVSMTLPHIDVTGERPVVRPPEVPNLPTHRGSGLVFEEGASSGRYSFGTIGAWNATTRKPHGGWLEAVALEFTVPDGSFDLAESTRSIGVPRGGTIRDFFEAADGWFERLNDWVAVTSDQDTYYAEPLRSFSTLGAGLTVVAVTAEGEVSSPAAANEHTVWQRETKALTLTKFRQIVKQANREEDPSEAHALLRDAYISLRRGHYRRAAIDAGAAAEMVLANCKRTLNNNIRPARGHATLGWLANLSGAPVPSGITTSLVAVRNAAIHENLAPTAHEALAAVEAARAIVHSGDPLPL